LSNRGDSLTIDLPNSVRHLLTVLNEHGYESFIVGGCVRDSLMGRIPYDWDIATSALPAEIKACFPHTYDTGIEHGTVTVVYGGRNYEITTYRVDGEYEDCRRPKSVSFTASLEEDLARRDFTINAMAWHPVLGLADPFGGIKDLENRIIRGVGDPDLRFKEDALRLLRAIRFSGQLDFIVCPETLAAIKRNTAGLMHISAERIRDELTKLLLSPHPERISLLPETGLLGESWPLPMKPTEDEIGYSIDILKKCPKKVSLVYSVLFYRREPEEAYQAMKAMRFDNALCRETSLLIRWAKVPVSNQDYAVRKYLSLSGRSYFQGLLTLKRLMETIDCAILPLINERYERIIENGDCLNISDLQINGDDLLNMGLSGKHIGDTLNRLLDLVLHDPALNNKNTLKHLV